MPTSLLKQHCYCPMLLMQTTKTAVCLQTKAIFHHLYGFYLVFSLNFIGNTLPISLTRLLECISTISSVFFKCDHYAACWVTLSYEPVNVNKVIEESWLSDSLA